MLESDSYYGNAPTWTALARVLRGHARLVVELTFGTVAPGCSARHLEQGRLPAFHQLPIASVSPTFQDAEQAARRPPPGREVSANIDRSCWWEAADVLGRMTWARTWG